METTQEQILKAHEEMELRRGHYRTLTEALTEAMELCLAWQTADGSHHFNTEDLYDFAKEQDRERPLGEHEFYMVSGEGAIGKSPGFEWMTRWLLIPQESGKVHTAPQSTQSQAIAALFTGHYRYMMQALLIAVQRCMVWRAAATDDPIKYTDLFHVAKHRDETAILPSETFYMVSREGAIGLAQEGKEHLVRWLFIPMEQGEERDRLLAEVMEELKRLEAEEEQEQATEMREQTEATPSPTQRYCVYCGASILPGNLFCTQCGKRVS